MKSSYWKAMIVLLVMGLILPAYSTGTFAAPVKIGVNCTMKPGGAEEASIMKFKELVEQKSKGEMVVTPFMSGQLGGELPVLGLMKIGKTEMSVTGGMFVGQYAPEYNAANIPYLFTWEEEMEFLQGPAGKKISELALQKGGLVVYGPQYRAPRHMTSNRPIKEAADLKGLKMRLPKEPAWLRIWSAMGALPVAIPAPEIYLAMKTGQVDAHENTLVSPYSRSLWEVQKYIILTAHVYWPWWWVASDVWVKKLTSEQQKIIGESADIARKHGEKVEREKDDFYAAELKKKGMLFITPDILSFKKAARPAILEEVKRMHPDVQKAVMKYVPK
ncbi:MAG: TRAP transporter substrate-binding protein [Deltaproteobacteria bacterium]|jgi:tripartite ATP-independent transporter DctP family solute receptor|nr:TRAP transporter substrate-binding protein [Deltaproteobacteria bacterium]